MGCAMVVQLIVQLDCAIPGGIVQLIVQIGRNCPQKYNEINFPGPIFQPGPQKGDEINFSDGFPTRGHQKCDEIIFSDGFQTRTPEV